MKLTLAKARALGIPVDQPASRSGASKAKETAVARRRREENSRRLEDELFLSHGLPIPEREVEFALWTGRKWRFDYLFHGWLAVEKVGGVWSRGHHSRGKDQIDDMEKQNHAILLGHSVLLFTPEQFASGEAMAFIKKVLEAKL